MKTTWGMQTPPYLFWGIAFHSWLLVSICYIFICHLPAYQHQRDSRSSVSEDEQKNNQQWFDRMDSFLFNSVLVNKWKAARHAFVNFVYSYLASFLPMHGRLISHPLSSQYEAWKMVANIVKHHRSLNLVCSPFIFLSKSISLLGICAPHLKPANDFGRLVWTVQKLLADEAKTSRVYFWPYHTTVWTISYYIKIIICID